MSQHTGAVVTWKQACQVWRVRCTDSSGHTSNLFLMFPPSGSGACLAKFGFVVIVWFLKAGFLQRLEINIPARSWQSPGAGMTECISGQREFWRLSPTRHCPRTPSQPSSPSLGWACSLLGRSYQTTSGITVHNWSQFYIVEETAKLFEVDLQSLCVTCTHHLILFPLLDFDLMTSTASLKRENTSKSNLKQVLNNI